MQLSPALVAELEAWNAAQLRARLAYRLTPTTPRKPACLRGCGRRTEHPSGLCRRCR
jgi:hypothetical protein